MPFTCEICMETKSSREKFKNKKCSHDHCSKCISHYIVSTALDHNQSSEVKCPLPSCTKFLDPLSCRPILPTKAFVKWCDLLFYRLIEKMEWQKCPSCNQCVELRYPESHMMKCRCGCHFCYLCGVKLAWYNLIHYCPMIKEVPNQTFGTGFRVEKRR